MSQAHSNRCPRTGTKGTLVDNATIKCLVSVSLHRVEDTKHYFCPDSTCPVVYFAEDGSEQFLTQDLRERVYQKEPNAEDVLVCYCFLHTLKAIRSSVTNDGQSWIIEDIKDGIQQGHCACDWRNPQGNCCLGNVIRIVKGEFE